MAKKKKLAPTAGRAVADYIGAHLGETIAYTTLDELCGTSSSAQQYNLIVGPLLKDGVLKVAKRSLKRGNDKAPIYESYRICRELPAELPHSGAFMRGTANMGTVDKDLADLNPLLTQNGFLAKNRAAAKAWRPELLLLGEWLSQLDGPAEPAIPEERSFEIFHNEKLLSFGERRGGRTLTELINSTGLYPQLALMNEPLQDLVYYVPRTARRVLSVLIVENHAPYVRIRDKLEQGARVFFGRRVDGVVYGRGSNVASGTALPTAERLFAEGRQVRYLYWGDIDRTGISVYERASEIADVEPLLAAYLAMIDHAGEDIPAAGEAEPPRHMGIDIACQLDPARLETFMWVLAKNLRIPQEAVPPAAYGATTGARRLTETLRRRRV